MVTNGAERSNKLYDYYFIKFGLKKTASLRLQRASSIQLRRESLNEATGSIEISRLRKNANITNFNDGYLVKLGELEFFVKKPVEMYVLFETFVKEQYKGLKASDKLVVDVGAPRRLALCIKKLQRITTERVAKRGR